ncbi:MAG: hypothetical protein ACRD15_04180, partial [Vicinamibacterales bacterium]
LLFTYLFYFGGARHHGHYFLGLVAACWIASATRSVSGIPELAPARLASSAENGLDSANSARAARLPGARWSWLGRVRRAGADYTHAWRFLGLLAAVHILAGIYAGVLDIRVPFSGSRAAAAHIASHYPPDIPIVADPELPGVPLAALLHRDLYFAQSDRWGSFVIWNNRHQPSSLDRSVAAADRLAQELRRDVLLVLTYPEIPPPRFEHVGHFPGAIMTAESYDVYLLPSVAR